MQFQRLETILIIIIFVMLGLMLGFEIVSFFKTNAILSTLNLAEIKCANY